MALDNYRRSVSYSKKTSDTLKMIYSYRNIAWIYEIKQNYDSAAWFAKTAMSLLKQDSLSSVFPSLSHFLGEQENRKKNYSEAIIYFNSAIKYEKIHRLVYYYKSLNRVNVNDTIIFSYIGYLSVRLTLKELEHLNYQIQMHVYSQQLSEITVQGRYGRDFLDYEILESLPRELFSFCSFMEEGKIYVISGNENSYLSDKMFVYDIATDTWKESFKKFIPRFCHAAVYYEGKAFIMGGKCFSTNRRIEYTEPRIEIYDMIKDTVYVDEVNPHQAANPITFVYDNCLYVMGGTIKKK